MKIFHYKKCLNLTHNLLFAEYGEQAHKHTNLSEDAFCGNNNIFLAT